MESTTGKFYILNGKFKENNSFDINLNENNAYEVVRVIDKTPLFMEDHLERFRFSINKINEFFLFSEEKILNNTIKLIKKNDLVYGNIKILYNNGDFFYYIIPHSYPDSSLYKEGIKTSILNLQRERPNIKILNKTYKSIVSKFIKNNDIYEAILINDKGFITEGSRSNIFFVEKNTLYTSLGKNVLQGITRKKIIELIGKRNLILKEENIHVSSLASLDGAFITGTSPKILPIKKIDDYFLNSTTNKNIIDLIDDYDDLIKNYINKNEESYGN